MNAPQKDFTPVDSKAAVNLWRGQCLDLFARGEKAVSETILLAAANDHEISLRHLAGQRFADLEKLSAKLPATAKQNAALANALAGWKMVETRRSFLAHGVCRVAHEDSGTWVLILDVTNFRAGEEHNDRWAITEAEAAYFHTSLQQSFKSLSAQLGHLKIRLKAP